MKVETQLPNQQSETDSSATRPETLPTSGLHPTLSSRLLEPFRDPVFSIGLVMLIVSAVAFLLYDALGDPRRGGNGNTIMIMLHYGLFVIYSLILLTHGYLKTWKESKDQHRPARWLGLLLWLISAYALNREFSVFQESTEWLCWALVIIGTAMTAYFWVETMPIRAQQLLYLVLAMGWWLFAYMAVYIVQLYPVSIPLLIGLGLSTHTFVPITFAFVLGKRLWNDALYNEHLRPGVAVGFGIPIVAVGMFLTGWISDVNRIDKIRMETTTRQTSDLPEWVLLAQQLKPDLITNRLLLTGRVYDAGPFSNGNRWGISHLTNLDEVRQHDPLVVIASQLFPTNALPETDNLNLLKVLNDERHNTEEKFWTGRHLAVKDIVSQVRIWPQFRLSYTEKTIRIQNQARTTTEEALLTFHLPQGSVVSSMSLWVNGKEEPARLTTVAKADSAYRTIVGVDSRRFARDPSVVYWQEGNRITARVFPCRAGEDRRVKLGITSPLQLTGNELLYENPYFEGPNAGAADELVKIDFDQQPEKLKSPWLLDYLEGTNLTHKGRYQPDWTLRFNAPALSTNLFVMPQGELAYQMKPYQPALESFRPTDMYLDVNDQWSQDEFTAAIEAATQTKSRVWVFDDGLKQLTDHDRNAVFERLSKQRFSLFPIYRISNPATSLLITKGTASSPTLSDLKNTTFADRMQQASRQTEPIRTFCFGVGLSPYLKTLSELHILNVVHGSANDLITKVAKAHQFLHQPNEPGQVVLPESEVTIQELQPSVGVQATKTAPDSPSKAPDHLARLFTYNHLLQQIGRHYFTPNYQTDALIQEAQQAHVVSPLSSLVVLETEKDYERFGIKKDRDGLDNATLKQEGAVPEPHEWALLALVAGLIGWLVWKKSYAVA